MVVSPAVATIRHSPAAVAVSVYCVPPVTGADVSVQNGLGSGTRPTVTGWPDVLVTVNVTDPG